MGSSNHISRALLIVGMLSLSGGLHAQDSEAEKKADKALAEVEKSNAAIEKAGNEAKEKASQAVSDVDELRKLLEEQRNLLDAQQAQMQKQQEQIELQQQQLKQQDELLTTVQKQLDEVAKQQAAQQDPIQTQAEKIDSQSAVLAGLQSQIDEVKQAQSVEMDAPSEEEIALKERIRSLEESVAAIPQDPSTLMGMESFPGSFRVPGTNAAIKFGGFVKMSLVKNFDPLLSTDRFIVGSIPVGDDLAAVEEEISLTANQSRFNIDMREDSSLGRFRAFIEGDFAGENETFRLRHAYGQFGDILAGKTWTTFYDPQAAPEEVDFEGINGQSLGRQAQVRWFPKVGQDWDLQFALEDPQPEVTDYCDPNIPGACSIENRNIAEGVSKIPDGIVSIRRNWGSRYHFKFAGLVRMIRATSTYNPAAPGEYNGAAVTDTDEGWGLTASGVIKADWWSRSDNIKFQLIGGKGIGRYTNDTNTLGGLDGVFDSSQKLYALPLVAGFVAYERWWADKLRSTFIYSFVNINTLEFQAGNAYDKTNRISGNLFWSPISRVDIGTELIAGQRVNKDKQRGRALQWQIMMRYRF